MKACHVNTLLFNMQKVTHEPHWKACVVPQLPPVAESDMYGVAGHDRVLKRGEHNMNFHKQGAPLRKFVVFFLIFYSVDGRGHPQRNMTSKRKQQQALCILLDNVVSHGCPTGLAGNCRFGAERMWKKTSAVCIFEDQFALRVRN